MINKFTKEFTTDFCDENGAIKWNEIVELNSAIIAPTKLKVSPQNGANA